MKLQIQVDENGASNVQSALHGRLFPSVQSFRIGAVQSARARGQHLLPPSCVLAAADARPGIISDVKFKTFGCGSAIASSSYMTERVKGMSIDQAGQVKNTEIAKELCLPPVKCEYAAIASLARARSSNSVLSARFLSTVRFALLPSSSLGR